MQIFKNKIFNIIANLGVNDNMINKSAKKVIQLNVLSIITFISFHFFYAVLFFTSTGSKQKIFISYGIVLFIALLSYLLAYARKRATTKILFISNAYLGVFFFDVYLGSSVSMGVYYFPFLFVAIKLFSFKKEKLLLILFVLLPLLLNVLAGTVLKNHYDIHILTSQNIRNLRTFNFTFAFFLVIMYANYIINYELKNDIYIENARLSLQSLIDNTNGSLWSIDNNFEIIAANKLFVKNIKQNFGIDIEAGYDFKKLMYASNFPEEWLAFLEKSLTSNRIIQEYNVNGIIHEIQVAPILKENGIVMGAVFHDTDINIRKEYEKNISLANDALQAAIKSKEQFLSNMSHELRTPLNGIIGISNILLSEQKLDAQVENLEMLKYSSDLMLDLVNDILDYNKIDAKKIELENTAFDLDTLINKIAIFFNQRALNKGIKLLVETGSIANLIVTGDVLRLRQILNNLISNAIKFTEEGTVTIKAEKIKVKDDDTVKINFLILDTGIGIPDNKLDLIFSSFGQADNKITQKYGGTGLGLTISARLVELMDSKIQVKSTFGQGSIFSFELNLKEEKAENVAEEQSGILQSFKDIKALVVEDNKVNLMVIKRFLNSWGIDTSFAENGALALQMASENKYDVILMDLNMPIMDGKTATEHIRKFDRHTPIVAITASSGENLKQELLSYGINDYILKPFVPQVLYNVIKKMITK